MSEHTATPPNPDPATPVDALPLWHGFAPELDPAKVLFSEIIPGGGHGSWLLSRGTALRLAALDPAANASVILYATAPAHERYNMPDSLKAQHTAHFTRGHVLMSDMGHAMLSITADATGWHDPLAGHGNATLVRAKYGVASYQETRNEWYRNAHDNFLLEAAKHGLGKRDLVANVNFFSRVDVDEDGAMKFHAGNSKAGDSVDLRAEMNVLVILNTCQHPLDPNPEYAPKPIALTIVATPPPRLDDACRTFRAENQRAFTLTERLFI